MTAVIGISLSALILAVFLKEHNKTASVGLTLAAGAYAGLMLKVLGIVLITQFISDICRDSGENALAGQTETAAKIIVISMILPLFDSVINIISGFLK